MCPGLITIYQQGRLEDTQKPRQMIGESGTYDQKQAADKRLKKRTLAFKDFHYFLPGLRKSYSKERIAKLVIENDLSDWIRTVEPNLSALTSQPTIVQDQPPEVEGESVSNVMLGKRVMIDHPEQNGLSHSEPVAETLDCGQALMLLEGEPQSTAGRDIVNLLGEIPALASIRRQLWEERQQSESFCQEYYRRFRIQTEIWKKYMVKRNPVEVSFKVHDMASLCTRVVQTIPRNIQFISHTMPVTRRDLTGLQECGHEEMNREVARDRLVDTGWSIEELVDFGIENMKVLKKDNDLFVRLISTSFKDKTLGEVIDLHELVKNQFQLHRCRREYRLLNEGYEQQKFIQEQRTLIFEFLVNLVYCNLQDQARISFFLPARRVRILFRELKQMFAS